MSRLSEMGKRIFRRSILDSSESVKAVQEQSLNLDGFLPYLEWKSPNAKYKVIVTNFRGEEFGRMTMKDVHLELLTAITGVTLMRVQTVTNTEIEQVEYDIYLNVIKKEVDSWHINTVVYRQSDQGQIKLLEQRFKPKRSFMYQHLSDEAFNSFAIQSYFDGGVRMFDELPEEIDVLQTAQLFMQQLKRQDFSQPKLVQKQGKIEKAL